VNSSWVVWRYFGDNAASRSTCADTLPRLAWPPVIHPPQPFQNLRPWGINWRKAISLKFWLQPWNKILSLFFSMVEVNSYLVLFPPSVTTKRGSIIACDLRGALHQTGFLPSGSTSILAFRMANDGNDKYREAKSDEEGRSCKMMSFAAPLNFSLSALILAKAVWTSYSCSSSDYFSSIYKLCRHTHPTRAP